MKYLAAWILASVSLLGADVEGVRGSEVRVVPVDRTPEPDEVQTHIAFPANGDLYRANPVTVQVRLEGYPLGYDSQFPREREIRNSGEGQALHILIDDKPFIAVDQAIDDTVDNDDMDFDQTIETDIPYNLKPGIHVVRIFPVRSFGESLKGDGCFEAKYFYVENQGTKTVDLSRAYLTYNEPQGEFTTKQPVLLDFYISNTQLSRDGYKVRLTIDGNDKRILTQWTPYYIYGLSRGTHTIRLDLLDSSNNIVPPLFDDTQKTIRIK